MAELHLEHVTKTFGQAIHALDDISLTVNSGECLAILGASGCGKTTLLRVIAGLERPTTGLLRIAGQPMDCVPPHRRGVAMLFQRPALIPGKTVQENLGWGWLLRASWFGTGRNPDGDAKIASIAGTLGLENDLNRRVQELSGGQQQRVALGRCLLREAKVCLLDEPLGHLDAPLRADLRRQICAHAREHAATMLFVTHDPQEAMAVGDRVAVIEKGRIVQIDEPARLRQFPAHRLVAELVSQGRGGMNFLAGALTRDSKGWRFDGPLGAWTWNGPGGLDANFIVGQEKLLSHQGKIHTIMGIAADRVACRADRPADADLIQLTLPMTGQEVSASGVFLIGRDSEGQRWLARGDHESEFRAGQQMTMTFSIRQTFGFDMTTGRTLWAPTG